MAWQEQSLNLLKMNINNKNQSIKNVFNKSIKWKFSKSLLLGKGFSKMNILNLCLPERIGCNFLSNRLKNTQNKERFYWFLRLLNRLNNLLPNLRIFNIKLLSYMIMIVIIKKCQNRWILKKLLLSLQI